LDNVWKADQPALGNRSIYIPACQGKILEPTSMLSACYDLHKTDGNILKLWCAICYFHLYGKARRQIRFSSVKCFPLHSWRIRDTDTAAWSAEELTAAHDSLRLRQGEMDIFMNPAGGGETA
jgi:hypothetical protein